MHPTTEHSVKHAIDTGSIEIIDRLLSSGAQLLIRPATFAVEKDKDGLYGKALLAKRQDIPVKRATFFLKQYEEVLPLSYSTCSGMELPIIEIFSVNLSN